MQLRAGTFPRDQGSALLLPHERGSQHDREGVPVLGAYLLCVATLEQRRRAFGRFVRVAMADARARGLTVAEIEKRTGVTNTTMYRWRDGDWTKDPRPGQVRAFCAGLEIPWEPAFRVLGWTTDQEQVSEPEPILPPEIREILRVLNDPNVSETEKAAIRQMLQLIARPQGRRRTG